MKKYFLIGILSFAYLTINAQFVQFGLRGGISSSNIRVDDRVNLADGAEYSVKSGDAMVGFHAGLIGRVQLFNISIQPELLFTSSGGEVLLRDIATGEQSVREQKFNKLDFPIMAGIHFGPARLQLGPVGSILLSSDSKLFEREDAEDEFKKATFGYQVGVGLDISRLAIDLKYEGNLSKLGDGAKIGGNDYGFDSRNNQFIISIGFFF